MNRSTVGAALAAVFSLGLCSCDSEKSVTPAADAVHGAVVDQNGKPIAGAKVAARRAQVEATTDENGEYSLQKPELMDGTDTLDVTDNKLIQVAMPITWKVKRFEDAVVVRRKLTGSVAGDLGGLSKARIHWRTKGTGEGIPQVVDLANGSYQGEIATLFSKDSLEVQIFLLDTARRVVGKSRLLQINPRSGNIVVPAFPKLNTFESLVPTFGCGQMGSWDTCTVRLTQPEDSSTRMWFREGGETWTEFQGAFAIPPRLRRVAPWMKERLHTTIEILRTDSVGVERQDTILIPWKKKVFHVEVDVVDGKLFEFDAKVPTFEATAKISNRVKVEFHSISEFDSLVGWMDYGYSEWHEYQYNCTIGGCQKRTEVEIAPVGRIGVNSGEVKEITFPKSGSWWVSTTVRANSGEWVADTMFFGVHIPTPPVYDVAGIHWDSNILEIEFARPFVGGYAIDLDLGAWCYPCANDLVSGDLMPDRKTVRFAGLDSMFEGGEKGLVIRDYANEDEEHGANQLIQIPRSAKSLEVEAKFKDRLMPFNYDYLDSPDSVANIELTGSDSAFDVRFTMPTRCAKECGVGAVYWKAPSTGPCNQKLRFRAKGSDSTLLRLFTDVHSEGYADWGWGSSVAEVMISEVDSNYSPYEVNVEMADDSWYSKAFYGAWSPGTYDLVKTPLRLSIFAATCGNLDPANCSKERWLSVSDIEVYSDCVEPVSEGALQP